MTAALWEVVEALFPPVLPPLSPQCSLCCPPSAPCLSPSAPYLAPHPVLSASSPSSAPRLVLLTQMLKCKTLRSETLINRGTSEQLICLGSFHSFLGVLDNETIL